MPESTRNLVAQLRKMLGDYKTTEEDYYVSDEIAEFDPEHMFSYFRGTLSEKRKSEIQQFSAESKSFLEDLIGVGEIVLAEEQETVASPNTIWTDLRGLSKKTKSNRLSFLKSTNGVRFELSPASMLAADSGGVEIESSLDFEASVSVYEDGGELVIKLSSDDASHHGMLVGLCLSGEKSDRFRALILRKGVLDKVTGLARLNREDLSGNFVLHAVPVNPDSLQESDAEYLAHAIKSDHGDQRSTNQWRQLIDRLHENDAPAELIGQLTAALSGYKEDKD